MKNKINRFIHKNIYSSIQQKSLKNVIKRELVLNFGYDNKLSVADLLADTLLGLVEEYAPEEKRLRPMQLLWTSVDRYDPPGHGKTIAQTAQKTITLDLWTAEEIDKLSNGVPPLDLFPQRVARVAKQALAQDGLLNQTDLALIFNKSNYSIRKAIDKWKKETGEILPLRGTMHDLGKTFSHKRQIIELHLKGYRCSKIARMTQHDPENVDRYIRDFERVLEFAQESVPVQKICFFTGMSHSLVEEYLAIIKEQKVLEEGVDCQSKQPDGDNPKLE